MTTSSAVLVLFNKPYDVLCQFTADKRPCLADYLPLKNIYPAGRLDRDSEGLLLLTDNGKLQAQISNPRFKLPKTYWAQVEGIVSVEALASIEAGLVLKDGMTLPARAKAIAEPNLWPRTPPIRERRNIPTSWVELTIQEGRNRQVRRMLAAVGFPVLRLVRTRVGKWDMNALLPGQYKRLSVDVPPAKTPHSKIYSAKLNISKIDSSHIDSSDIDSSHIDGSSASNSESHSSKAHKSKAPISGKVRDSGKTRKSNQSSIRRSRKRPNRR